MQTIRKVLFFATKNRPLQKLAIRSRNYQVVRNDSLDLTKFTINIQIFDICVIQLT